MAERGVPEFLVLTELLVPETIYPPDPKVVLLNSLIILKYLRCSVCAYICRYLHTVPNHEVSLTNWIMKLKRVLYSRQVLSSNKKYLGIGTICLCEYDLDDPYGTVVRRWKITTKLSRLLLTVLFSKMEIRSSVLLLLVCHCNYR